MIARITVGAQTNVHANVVEAWAEHGYLKLRLASHPHQVNYYMRHASALVCATEQDFIGALREEQLEREWNMTAMDEVRR